MTEAEWTDRTLQRALAHVLAVAGALDAVHDAAWAAVDHALLEPCRERMAMLLGASPAAGGPDDTVDGRLRTDLASWPTAERFDASQRACIAYAEQHVLDVASMPPGLTDDLFAALGHDAALDFVNALLVVEQRLRLSLAFDRLLGPGAGVTVTA